MNAPAMPGLLRRALADLVRFGSLIEHRGSYVADVTHWPDCAHDAKAIAAIVGQRFGEKLKDGTIAVTAEGRRAWDALQNAAAAT